MFSIINAIPLWVRLILLLVGEMILIYDLIKHRQQYDKAKKVFPVLLILFIPIFSICMILDKYAKTEIICASTQSISDKLSFIISILFVLGILIATIMNLIRGNISRTQRTTMITALSIFLIAVLVVVGITTFESLGFI